MTLEVVATWSEVLGSLAVVAAIIFGYMQIQQFRTQRRDLAAIELVRSFQDEQFTHGYRILHVLPDGMSAEEFRALGDEYEEMALAIAMKYESVGLLVFRGIVPLDIVDELVGGVGLMLWIRIKPWIYATRNDNNHPTFMEWFEWLALQLEDRCGSSNIPAHERYRDWTPEH